ncbi:hypothetical protein EB796_019505 [Bugula neritina]|uniref:Uncharacterized protein n=1 Tax=Bugula neritina TaxID=10212 RepID=A0A7J7JA03_BUGNE|nr:hypothetical protein EB796_019505 [Bugula neritina]
MLPISVIFFLYSDYLTAYVKMQFLKIVLVAVSLIYIASAAGFNGNGGALLGVGNLGYGNNIGGNALAQVLGYGGQGFGGGNYNGLGGGNYNGFGGGNYNGLGGGNYNGFGGGSYNGLGGGSFGGNGGAGGFQAGFSGGNV